MVEGAPMSPTNPRQPAEPETPESMKRAEPSKPMEPPAPLASAPSSRYRANVRLIQSRLKDDEKTRAKPWWRFLK